jgi:hypothetical protein
MSRSRKRGGSEISPYHDRVSEWSRKWRFKFSGPKSSLVTFTRQKRKQTKPLLFISGARIPEVNAIKPLEVIFDKGLRWTN